MGSDQKLRAGSMALRFVVAVFVVAVAAPAARAQGNLASPASSPALPGEAAEPTSVAPEAAAEIPMVDAATQVMAQPQYGLGMRGRWISVPSWLLDLFTRENVPLSSYAAGLEFFRRTPSFDLLVGLTYQAMSPSDGNWLGNNHPPEFDTDYLQFRNLGLWGLDAAFILHTDFNEFVGIHYGGGIGLGVVTGKLLRTSAGSPGCKDTPGDETRCFPIACTQGPCSEQDLKRTEGMGMDAYNNPSRSEEKQVPSIIPIVNVVAGLDFRIPGLRGFEAKIEGGFYAINFFVGGGIAYRL